MKIIREIEFTGKNLNDVFRLPCVKAIMKIEAMPVLVMRVDKMRSPVKHHTAEIGDRIVEFDNNKWKVLRGDETV